MSAKPFRQSNPIKNTYESRLVASSVTDVATESSVSRPVVSIALAVGGATLGAALCSIGYIFVVFALENVLVPPFRSPANYGQFGFTVIFMGIIGFFGGASFALIPYTRFFFWLPVFAFIPILVDAVVAGGEYSYHFNLSDVTCFAMVVTASAMVFLGWLISFATKGDAAT